MWNLFAKEEQFPYRVSERGRPLDFSVCLLHDGTHKTRGGVYSVFQSKLGSSQPRQYSSLNIKRLKTLRHPNVLAFVYHSDEDPHYEYVVTEKGTPLLEYIEKMKESEIKSEYIAWGVMKILKALIFCHESAKLLHNNVGSNAVFVNRAGEWKLAEFGISDESYSGPLAGTRAEQYHRWIKHNSKVTWELDTYGVAVLVLEAYEGRIHTDQSVPDPTDKVPEPFRNTITSIFNGNKIPTLQTLLSNGTAQEFRNEFIGKITFLEEIHQKNTNERREFFGTFHDYLKKIPSDIRNFKIFPLIMLSYDYGCEGSELLPTVLEFCNSSDQELDLVPLIGRLFKSPSRKTRNALLAHMREYITVLAPSVLNETIYPMWEVGLQDGSEVIRQETVRSIEYLVPRLERQRINKHLLPRLVSRLEDEAQGNIRELILRNVLVVIKNHSEPMVRKQLLMTVIAKALKDEYPPMKCAAINGMVELQDHFTQYDIARKLLPPLCHLTIDRSWEVKQCAIRTIRSLLDKAEKSEPEEMMKDTPKHTSLWTEWVKTMMISSNITSIFAEDETPKPVNKMAMEGKNEQSNKVETQEVETMAKEQRTECNQELVPDQNQDCVNKWEKDQYKPNCLTNNDEELKGENHHTTRREGKKLKRPSKLGTRINQQK